MLKYLLPILLVSCATTKPKPIIVKKEKQVKLPTWTHETCKQTKNGYLVVGYGEGANLASSTRQALISSRGDALLCVFGGTYTASTVIHDTNTESSVKSKTNVKYHYESVNWYGYKKSDQPIFFTRNGKNGIYVQYYWNIKYIDEERKRLDALNQQIETNRAMKEQVKVKDKLIKEQKKTLDKIKKQQIELNRIENETKRAIYKLGNLKSKKNNNNKNIKQIIDSLECGITPQELIEIYKSPDSFTKTYCSIEIVYGKFNLKAFDCKKKDNLYQAAIDEITTNYGKQRYKYLCTKL